MKKLKINHIINLIALLALFIFVGVTFAWFIPRTNSGVLSSGDVKLDIDGYVDQIKYENSLEENKSSIDGFPKKLNDSRITVTLSGDELLYVFVVKNSTNVNVTVELRLSDFTTYIFDSYGNNNVNLTNKAKRYNSKFYLYFDEIKIKDGICVAKEKNDEAKEVIVFDDNDAKVCSILQSSNIEFVNSTNFLWKYGSNNPFVRFDMSANSNKTIFVKLKNDQNSDSITVDYKNFLYEYGISYIKDLKKETDEDKIIKYLNDCYKLEIETLSSKDGKLPETSLDIDYFEFVADSNFNE